MGYLRVSMFDMQRVYYTMLFSQIYKYLFDHIQSKHRCLVIQNHMTHYDAGTFAVGHTPLNTPDPI